MNNTEIFSEAEATGDHVRAIVRAAAEIGRGMK